jgi:hypothetical protein
MGSRRRRRRRAVGQSPTSVARIHPGTSGSRFAPPAGHGGAAPQWLAARRRRRNLNHERATSSRHSGRSRGRPADRAGHGDRLPRRLRRLATERRPQGSTKGTTPTRHDQSRPVGPGQDGNACLDPVPLATRSAQCRDDTQGVVDQISGRPQAVERQKAPRTTENCRDVSALVETRFQLKAPARKRSGERSRRSTRARTRSSAW